MYFFTLDSQMQIHTLESESYTYQVKFVCVLWHIMISETSAEFWLKCFVPYSEWVYIRMGNFLSSDHDYFISSKIGVISYRLVIHGWTWLALISRISRISINIPKSNFSLSAWIPTRSYVSLWWCCTLYME